MNFSRTFEFILFKLNLSLLFFCSVSSTILPSTFLVPIFDKDRFNFHLKDSSQKSSREGFIGASSAKSRQPLNQGGGEMDVMFQPLSSDSPGRLLGNDGLYAGKQIPGLSSPRDRLFHRKVSSPSRVRGRGVTVGSATLMDQNADSDDDDDDVITCSRIPSRLESLSGFPIHSNVRVEVESSVGSEDVAFNLTQELGLTSSAATAPTPSVSPSTVLGLNDHSSGHQQQQQHVPASCLSKTDSPPFIASTGCNTDLVLTAEDGNCISSSVHGVRGQEESMPAAVGTMKLTSLSKCLHPLQDLGTEPTSGLNDNETKIENGSSSNSKSSQPASDYDNIAVSSSSATAVVATAIHEVSNCLN